MQERADTAPTTAPTRNRYDLQELAGAFGDLGTLIPFVVAYISIVKMDPGGILLAFGSALIAVGLIYKTPFPVQPMKAIGAVAVTQGIGAVTLTPLMVAGAGVVTAAMWLFLAATGLARWIANWIPRPALLGVVMGLGFTFMLEGIRMMAGSWLIAAGLLAGTLLVMSRSKPAAMLLLLAIGAAIALLGRPELAATLSLVKPAFQLPTFAWPALSGQDLWLGMLLLALPQLPLTFGNAFVAITEENNRLFPDRPVTARQVAYSTGFLNLWSSALGGIPMCHGAGGMAGHVKFGARTGGSSVMLGIALTVLALFFAGSVDTLFQLFPPAVLGVVLFIAGAELALSSRDPRAEKEDRFVVIATAAFAVLHVGVAVLFGVAAHVASKRGWLKF
ncbi:MAG: sulP2 [Ramlibacter sp.]|jgi:MFS superfamily sulfate permease-like transporter|nr:sulP2 [Ramlibacter sp.]